MTAQNHKEMIDLAQGFYDDLLKDNLVCPEMDHYIVITNDYVYIPACDESYIYKCLIANRSRELIDKTFDEWLNDYEIGDSRFIISTYKWLETEISSDTFYKPPEIPYRWIYSVIRYDLYKLIEEKSTSCPKTFRITDDKIFRIRNGEIYKIFTKSSETLIKDGIPFTYINGFSREHCENYKSIIRHPYKNIEEAYDNLLYSELYDVGNYDTMDEIMQIAEQIRQIYSRNLFRSTKKYHGHEDCVIVCID